MPTKKQIESNRRNARKSTGPRTDEGKARSRLNALRHGLLAQDSTLPIEDQHEFQALQDALAAEYQPQGPTEECLLARMADAQWRLARLTRIETGYLQYSLEEARKSQTKWNNKFDPDDHSRAQNTRLLGIVAERDGKGPRMLSTLPRYEAGLRRAWYRAMETLEARRKEKLRNEPDSVQPTPNQGATDPPGAPSPLDPHHEQQPHPVSELPPPPRTESPAASPHAPASPEPRRGRHRFHLAVSRTIRRNVHPINAGIGGGSRSRSLGALRSPRQLPNCTPDPRPQIGLSGRNLRRLKNTLSGRCASNSRKGFC